MRFQLGRCAIALVSLLSWASQNPNLTQYSHSGPRSMAYGEQRGFPVGDSHTWSEFPYLVGSYSHFDAIFPARGVPHPADVWSFGHDRAGLRLTYRFNGRANSIDDYLSHVPVTGL